MGIWSCLGQNLDDVRDALYQGKSGIIFSQERKDAGFRSALCADVPAVNIKKLLARNVRQFMPEEAQYAYVATQQALENAGIDQDFLDAHEVGIIYGNDSVAESTMIALDKFREFKDTSACGSGAIFQSMNSTVTMNLACLFKLRGINLTSSAACASSSLAIDMPRAAEMELLAWPAWKVSYSLSLGLGNPLKPPILRFDEKRSRRPVNILWA